MRELARKAALSDGTVRQELGRLEGLGVVTVRRSGNRAYYRAESSHPLYRDLRSLVLKTSGLVEVLREALQGSDIHLAFVFGSVAAGTESAGSDVDLMVVGSTSLRQVTKLVAASASRIGREINPHVLTVDELGKRKRKGDHFISSILRSPRLFVIRDDDELEAVG